MAFQLSLSYAYKTCCGSSSSITSKFASNLSLTRTSGHHHNCRSWFTTTPASLSPSSRRACYASASSLLKSTTQLEDKHHNNNHRWMYHRSFSSNANGTNNYASKLGLGGHKWDRIVELSPDEYTNLIQTSLNHGITTLESGQDGGEQVLADAYRKSRTTAATTNVVTMSARVGYRTVIVPSSSEEQEQEKSEEEKKQDDTDTSSSNNLLPQDVLVEQHPVPATSKGQQQEQTSSSKMAHIVHNTSSTFIYETLKESPLCQLYQESPNDINLIYMLHNPEVQQLPQQETTEQSSQNQERLYDTLVDAFRGLEQCVQDGLITSFGVCSNGFTLEETHPLYLNWKVVIDAANQAALEMSSKSENGDQGQPQQKSHLTTLQLPLNLMEPNGFLIARDIQSYFKEEQQEGVDKESEQSLSSTSAENVADQEEEEQSETQPPLLVQPLEIWAMRPLTCYPNQGVGEEHPYQLIDYPLQTLSQNNTDGESTSSSSQPQQQQQWTNDIISSSTDGSHFHPGSDPQYTMALNAALSHFDGTELLELKQDRPLTMEERETLDGCKLLHSMIHDLDVALEDSTKFPSMVAYEQELYTKIIPLIYDTFEELDEESATVLQTFFATHGKVVRQTIAQRTRQMLLDGSTEGDSKSKWPKYNIPAEEKLQDYAMKFLLQEDSISKVIVGYENSNQVIEAVQVANDIKD